jgi:hypothetical protein
MRRFNPQLSVRETNRPLGRKVQGAILFKNLAAILFFDLNLLALNLSANEIFSLNMCLLIGVLLRWRLHEVT